MKQQLLLLFLVTFASAQMDEWHFISNKTGSTFNGYDLAGNPGDRRFQKMVVDSHNNVWMFGGTPTFNAQDARNDLWKFSLSDQMWYWISGSNKTNHPGNYTTTRTPAADTFPAARESFCMWIDASNDDIYIYGGYIYFNASFDAGLSDLWVFHTSTGMWEWLGPDSPSANFGFNYIGSLGALGSASSANWPPSRYDMSCWRSSNALWVLGGQVQLQIGGANYDMGGDLWKFDGTYWTWLAGAPNKTIGPSSSGGVSDTPGYLRYACTSSVAHNNSIYLFGGYGGGAFQAWQWHLNLVTVRWTLLSGRIQANALGNYTYKRQARTDVYPGSRIKHACWDVGGYFYMMGGYGYTDTGAAGFLNDLWRFNPANLTWEWLAGSAQLNQVAVYNDSDPLNITPGGTYSMGCALDDNTNMAYIYGNEWTTSSAFWKFQSSTPSGGGSTSGSTTLPPFSPTSTSTALNFTATSTSTSSSSSAHSNQNAQSKSVAVVVGATVGAVVPALSISGIVVCVIYRRKKSSTKHKHNETEMSLSVSLNNPPPSTDTPSPSNVPTQTKPKLAKSTSVSNTTPIPTPLSSDYQNTQGGDYHNSLAASYATSPPSPVPPPKSTAPLASSTSLTTPSPIPTNATLITSGIEIGAQLGSGQFGEVYLGTWHGTPIALKKLKNAEQQRDFEAEVAMLQSLLHPNVLHYYGCALVDGYKYMATEYMADGSLKDLLPGAEAEFSVKMLTDMAKSVASGMCYLHEHGVVHRDLALRNVLAAKQGSVYTVKVADFGMSRVIANNDYYKSTETTMPVRWTAPESLEYGKFSTKSDVYSFGILLWEIFSFGRIPFMTMSNQEVIKHVVAGNRLDKPQNCPEAVFEVMQKCWAHSSNDRPTFAEIHAQLSEISKQLALLAPSTTTTNIVSAQPQAQVVTNGQYLT